MNHLRILALVFAFSLASSSFGQSSGRYDVHAYSQETFASGFPGDHILPHLDANGNPQPVVVYSIALDGTLAAKEVLLVTCELLVRSADDGSVKTTVGIYLGTQPTYLDSENSNAFQICEANGENQDHVDGLEDMTYVKVGTYKYPDPPDSLRKYVNVYAYSRAGMSDPEDVEVLASRLSVVRFTPVLPPQHGSFSALFEDTTSPASITANTQAGANVIFAAELDSNQSDPLKTGK